MLCNIVATCRVSILVRLLISQYSKQYKNILIGIEFAANTPCWTIRNNSLEMLEKEKNISAKDAFSCEYCGPEAICQRNENQDGYRCICKNNSLSPSSNSNCSRVTNLVTEPDQQTKFVNDNIIPCEPNKYGVCGNDATCRRNRTSNRYHCVCISDNSLPSSDLKCPTSQFRQVANKNENLTSTRCNPHNSTSCGTEAHCELNERLNKYHCVCPDSSLPSSDFQCPFTNARKQRQPEKKSGSQLTRIPCDLKDKKSNCGREAVCARSRESTDSFCICPQDTSFPSADLKCPLKKVSAGVTSERTPIHVLVASPNLKTNLPSQNRTPASNYSNITSKSLIPPSPSFSIPASISESKIVILTATLVLSLLLLIFIWRCILCISVKKKKKNHKNKAFAIPLRKNILTEERYTTNPHYTSAGSSSENCIPMVPIISRSAITDLQKIGEGFFGKVYKGQFHATDNNGVERIETVAVKMLKHTTNVEAEEDFMREVEIMSSFEHTNILTLIGLCPRENTSSPWMVFEFMPLGDLASVLRKSSLQFWSSVSTLPTLSSESLLSIALQISEGMEYLARQRFVHRDLACRNCLVGSDLVVKIADFGMSRDVYTCDYYKFESHQIGGTRMLPVRWMSPESIVFGRFTLESDIWSYGVVLWEIYSYGKQPYYGHSNEEVLKFILDGILLSIPDDCPDEVTDIMKACWRKDIKERIMFSEICTRLSKLKESMSQQSTTGLPRPPRLPVTIDHPALMMDKEDDDDTDDEKADNLLDEDDYLRPISRSESVSSEEYIEPIHIV